MLIRAWPILLLVASLSVLAWGSSFLRAQTDETGDEKDNTIVLKPLVDPYSPERRPDLAEAATRLVALTNDLRLKDKIQILKGNPKLDKVARYFADYMARTSRYGHQADGNTPDSRAKEYGYDYCIVAENIAYELSSVGFTTDELARKFYEGWKASPGHHKNMVDPDVIETGLAVSQGESGYVFAVQMFARPKSMSVEFEITNHSPTAVHYEMRDEIFDLDPQVTRTHQACRLQDLAFRWSDADGKKRLVQPNHGDRFVVTHEDGAPRLRREKQN